MPITTIYFKITDSATTSKHDRDVNMIALGKNSLKTKKIEVGITTRKHGNATIVY